MSASEREIRKHLVREIVDYTVAIRRDPQDADAYLNRGVAYENQGEHERAIEEYDEAVRLNPQLADAYTHRLWGLEQWVRTIDSYEPGKLV